LAYAGCPTQSASSHLKVSSTVACGSIVAILGEEVGLMSALNLQTLRLD
jgi:hypothetical protein